MELNFPDSEDDAHAFPLKISKVSPVPELWKIYKRATIAHWTPEVVNLADDKLEWNGLAPPTKVFILKAIAFLASNEKVLLRDLDVNSIEARFFFSHKAAMKNIHLEMYSNFIEAFEDPSEQESCDLQKSLGAIDLVAWTWEWVQNENLPLPIRLLALAVSEEVFSSTLTLVKDACQNGNILKGLRHGFQLISRDKDFSVEFTCALFTYGDDRPHQMIVHSLVQEAVEIHSCWAKGLLSECFPGQDANRYACSAANKLLLKLGYSEVESFESMHLHREEYKEVSKVEIKSDRKKDFQKKFENLYKEGVTHLHKEKMEGLAKEYGDDYLSICLWFLQKEGDNI